MNRTQKKTLFLLLGILVGLGILLAVVSAVKRSSAQREAEEAAAQDAASVITETEAAYSSLTYDNGNATLSFHLDEAGKWVWSDDPEFPLDDSTIQSILTLLTNLKPQQTITEGDTLEAYGLDQPFATLTAAKPDGGTLTISLGNTTTDGNSYYMLMNDDTKFFPGIFDEMAPHLKKDEVTVGAICGENGGLSYGGIKYTKGIKYKKLGPDAPEVNCDTFNANCAIIPREIFEKVGIDPFYQHSIGDFDYGLQISKLGYKIHIYPKFVGECNDNTLQKTWQDETLPRMERIRLKESRKGLPFRDWFHFLHKNFGLGTAIVRSITPYIRIILGTKTRYSGA